MVALTGTIFNIQRFSTEDGPGIRTSVFFKGCPLACQWCSNPESQQMPLQLACRNSVCIGCGSCIEACPDRALSFSDDPEDPRIVVDRAICCSCGTCIEACPSGALRFYGRVMTVDEVFDVVRRDAEYYLRSGGGVTASGGECMMQADFVEELFRRCKGDGIHTTLDTCGFFNGDRFRMMSDCVDLVLYDLKLMDSERHELYTGVPNGTILQNVKLVSELGISLFVRVPLIPGITDTEENLEAIASFVSELPTHPAVNLLPYHNYGENKYEMLGWEYKMHGLKRQSKEQLDGFVELFANHNLECTVQ